MKPERIPHFINSQVRTEVKNNMRPQDGLHVVLCSRNAPSDAFTAAHTFQRAVLCNKHEAWPSEIREDLKGTKNREPRIQIEIVDD